MKDLAPISTSNYHLDFSVYSKPLTTNLEFSNPCIKRSNSITYAKNRDITPKLVTFVMEKEKRLNILQQTQT